MFFDDIFFDSKKNDVELFNTKDGLLYGNMFKNEYKPYKNYKPVMINATDDKSNLLLNIYELDFAMNDFSLYLDLHPNNNDVYRKFKACANDLDMLVKKYETQYGPMELCDSDYDSYQWVFSKLPFKGGNI